MPDSGPTIAALFFGDGGLDSQGRKQLEKDKELGEIKQQLSQKLGKGKWKLVAREIGSQLVKVLDVGIAQKVLGPAWSKWDGLQKYRDPSTYPPGESILAPLAEHSIESSHSPHLDLTLAGNEIARLDLQVGLALDLLGVTLRLQDGRILGVQAGEARGRGTLALAVAGREIWTLNREMPSISLAAGIDFGEGIMIAPPDPAPSEAADPA